LKWQLGTVMELRPETERATSIILRLPGWQGHLAGQHVDVRLTAEDGYQAQRSYSIASAPEDADVVLTVERITDGEVSSYLAEELRVGDELELRGPIGGYFVWKASLGSPVVLLAGGSGIAPLRAMLRHRLAHPGSVPVRMLYSARALEEVIYRDELEAASGRDGIDVRFTLTRDHPQEWTGYTGRITPDMIASVAWPPADAPLIYVCGPTGFVEQAADALVSIGHLPARVRTERFGPTGR
jgi:ferredoxin-NADP reductase